MISFMDCGATCRAEGHSVCSIFLVQFMGSGKLGVARWEAGMRSFFLVVILCILNFEIGQPASACQAANVFLYLRKSPGRF